VPRESIELVSVSNVEAEQVSQAISDSEPRYSFLRYTHTYEGQELSPIVFIYTCPSGSKIKERMLYASSRSGIISTAETEGSLEISKRVSHPKALQYVAKESQLEATMPSEITASTLHEEFHPKIEQRQAFSRPKRPGKR
jgi:twinfilin